MSVGARDAAAVKVIRAGRVQTMADAGADGSVLVIRGDRIAAVGDESLRAAHPEAEVVDVGARTVIPGLIDAHNHLTLAALHPLWADASDVSDLESLQRLLRTAQPPAGSVDGWVRAFGWDERRLRLTRAELDEIEPDRPLVVVHFSYHQCVVNSAGLDALGISEHTADPPGGRLRRDANGRPTGALLERAWTAAHEASITAYQEPDRFGELIVERCQQLLREGITAVHEAACSPRAEAVLRGLHERGELPISVLANPHSAAMLGPLDPARLDGPPTGDGDELFRIGPVKLFADGGSRPAIAGHVGGRYVETGISFGSIRDDAIRAADRGFGVAVHVIGNAMLDDTLSAFEEIREQAPMLRIEHAMLVSRDQAARMASVGAVAVVQPNFVPLMGPAIEHLTFDDAVWLPFRMLADAGVVLAGSSDDPCDTRGSRPLVASISGETRLLPSGAPLGAEESVPFIEWVRAYTRGSAAAGGQEAERGALTAGLRADFVVLDGDLTVSSAPSVYETWVGGERVFQREPAPG